MLRKILLAYILMMVSSITYAQSEWELQIDKQGVAVYSRYVAGFDLKRVRATTQVKAQIDSVLATQRC